MSYTPTSSSRSFGFFSSPTSSTVAVAMKICSIFLLAAICTTSRGVLPHYLPATRGNALAQDKLIDLKIHCYEIKSNFPSNFSLMSLWRNTLTLNATNPITIRVMASNAADHKHNITRVSQFAHIHDIFSLFVNCWGIGDYSTSLQRYSVFLPILRSPITSGVASPLENLGFGGNELLY